MEGFLLLASSVAAGSVAAFVQLRRALGSEFVWPASVLVATATVAWNTAQAIKL